MRKLILTTALTGLVIGGTAIAQTSVTGELRITHKAVSSKAATAGTTTSNRGFGIEQQLNISNKGNLNVGGLSYAAGFSLENDGVQGTSLFNENNYIDIINAKSGTTISFSQDHIQRMDTSRSNSYHLDLTLMICQLVVLELLCFHKQVAQVLDNHKQLQ